MMLGIRYLRYHVPSDSDTLLTPMRIAAPSSPLSDNRVTEPVQVAIITNIEALNVMPRLQTTVDLSRSTTPVKQARQDLRDHPSKQETIWNDIIKGNNVEMASSILGDTDFRNLKSPVLAWAIHKGHVALAHYFFKMFLEKRSILEKEVGIHPNKGMIYN